MSTQRVMSGIASFEGRTVNSLTVGPMVSRRPEPRYQVTCNRCGTVSTETQGRIRSGAARCQSATCGKDRLRDHLNDTPQKARRRAEEHEAQLRHERETQQAAKIEAMQADFQKNSRAVALAIKERIEKGKDDGFFVSPELMSVSMPNEEAARFNREQAAIFARENPEYERYRSDETVNALGDYLARNGVRIADAATIKAAFHRLKEFGLIHPNPLPTPEPAPRPEPVYVNLEIDRQEAQPEQPTGPKVYIGRDWETGEDRQFTQREIDRMSSLEYKRAFPIAPTIAELLTAMEDQR